MKQLAAILLLCLAACSAPLPPRAALEVTPLCPVSLLPSDGELVIPGGWLYLIPAAWNVRSCSVAEPEWLGLPDYPTERWDWQHVSSRQWDASRNFVGHGLRLRHTYLGRVSEQPPCTLWYSAPGPLVYMTASGSMTTNSAVSIDFAAIRLSGADCYWWFVIDGPGAATPCGELYSIPADNVYSTAGLDPYWGDQPIRDLLVIEADGNAAGVKLLAGATDSLRGTQRPESWQTVWSAGVWTAETGELQEASGPICSRTFSFSQPGSYTVWFVDTYPHAPALYGTSGEPRPIAAGPPLLIKIQ